MSRKNISKDVLNVINKKTGKTVTQKDIHKLAGNVKPSTISDENQLRQLSGKCPRWQTFPFHRLRKMKLSRPLKKAA